MLYVDELRLSRQKPQVAFHEFALSVNKYPEFLFCFFEGKDNAYYVSRIKRFTNNFYPINCGNKSSVIAVNKLITSKTEYEKYRFGFFIDRDFDSPIASSNQLIFETPCYSVENFYVSTSSFREILINEFNLSELKDKLFNMLMELYIERQKEFHFAVTLFNAWYACLVDKRNTEGINIQVSLGEKLPNNFVIIELDKVSMNYDLNQILQTFPDAPVIPANELEAKIELFNNCVQHEVFRGKFELDFLLKMIKLILADSNKTNKIFKEKIKFSFGDGSSLNQQQLLNIFQAYADTPASLLDYLKKITRYNQV